MMLLKLYLMFYSKWFLEKRGHQGTGEHGWVFILTSFPHCARPPPHPLLPPTVLVHLLTLFFPPLCSSISSPSSSPHCARPPHLPLLPPTVLVHFLTLFFPPLCLSSPSFLPLPPPSPSFIPPLSLYSTFMPLLPFHPFPFFSTAASSFLHLFTFWKCSQLLSPFS